MPNNESTAPTPTLGHAGGLQMPAASFGTVCCRSILHRDNDDVQAALQAPVGSARVLHTEERG